MGFKEDADFARFLTLGAHGAVIIKRDLEQHGHDIIELERYAMGNKVWSIKVKRLRIPDLLCIRCGRRFESKAKSKLEIKLSHSASHGREWYAGGMRENDIFGFVRVVLTGNDAHAGKPLYVTRSALHAAFDSVKSGTRKAISEGSEADISWPIWVPSYSGQLPHIAPIDDEGNIYVHSEDGRIRTYKRRRHWSQVHLYIAPGEEFVGEYTAVAGCVEPASIRCAGDTWDWQADLFSQSPDDRYAAVKSCYKRSSSEVTELLRPIASNSEEDWRIRIEAAGVLAAIDPSSWVPFLESVAADTSLPPEQQIESVFVLSEISADGATDALYRVAQADKNRLEEVRAAAVWGLGTGVRKSPERVIDFLADDSDRVALHAASALTRKLSPEIVKSLQGWLMENQVRKAASAAFLLARHGYVQELLDVVTSSSGLGAMLALRALGDLSPDQVLQETSRVVPAHVLKVLRPLWVQHQDWLRRPENVGVIDLLDAQHLRFLD